MCHELEYITADGLLRIDLAVVDRRIAIEFGAQAQSASLLPIMPVVPGSGRMRVRDGLLSAIGWRVASIPLFECQWDKLHQPEQMDVMSYVNQRLSQDPVDQEMSHRPPRQGTRGC